MSTSRATLPLRAPNAIRRASSRCRVDARASRRLATLAQATSRTKPTAPMTSQRRCRTLPTRRSWSGAAWSSERSSCLAAEPGASLLLEDGQELAGGRRRQCSLAPAVQSR